MQWKSIEPVRLSVARLIPLVALLAAVLAPTALLAPTAFAEGWTDVRMAKPFVYRANFPLSQRDTLFVELTRLQNDLVELLGIQPASESIEIYLFRDESSYRRYLSYYFPKLPYRKALYIKQDGPGMVFAYQTEQLESDLRHECTHALLHAALPMVPLWLDEGLAEYFEMNPSKRAFNNPYLKKVRWDARFGKTPSLTRLQKKGNLSEMGKIEYRDAWAWTHFMLHGSRSAHDELTRYLNDIERSTPPGQLSERLNRRVPQLSTQFRRHFKGWYR